MATTTIIANTVGGKEPGTVSGTSTLETPISTTISYMKREPKFEHEKPYVLNYDTQGVIPKTNVTNDPIPILVSNFRSRQSPTNFEDYGFSVEKLQSTLAPVEFENQDKVETILYPEVERLLHKLFPDAAEIHMLEHQIRKRHPDFPIATGKPYEHPLPTTIVHIDWTLDSAKRSSFAAFKELTSKYRRLLTVNLWKSLQGPGNDWPVALCDRRTVKHLSEVVAQDVVQPDRFNENARLYYSPEHQWYYFEDLREDEIILFRQTDSDLEGGGGVPHSGFLNSRADKNAAPRVSIELRAFIYFE